MAGIKGQKWSKDKVDMVKFNSSVDRETFNKLSKMKKENRWTISATVRHIIEDYFKRR